MNILRIVAALAAVAMAPAVAEQPLSQAHNFGDAFLGPPPWLDPKLPSPVAPPALEEQPAALNRFPISSPLRLRRPN